MKKMNCDIIRDLLPLFLDDVVSDATKEMVEDHLKVCESCRKEAESLKCDVVLPAAKTTRLAEAQFLKEMKSRLRKKNTLVAFFSVSAAILIMIVLYSYAVLSKTSILYDSTAISITEEDGRLYAVYNGGDLGGTVSFAPCTTTVNGSAKNITGFYYYKTPWSSYIEPWFSSSRADSESPDALYLGNVNDIDQIYYGEFDTDGSSVDYEAVPENAQLIWEK